MDTYLRQRLVALAVALWISGTIVAPSKWAVAADDQEAQQYFSEQVQPLLREHCFECHSHEYGEAGGQLMLDSLSAMTRGGTRGATVIPGKPQQGLLLKAVLYEDTDLQMPPSGRLAEEQIAILRKWVADGANVPPSMAGPAAGDNEPAKPVATDHWAYQMPRRWNPASAPSAASVIDQIVVGRLHAEGLEPSQRADRQTLIRRLSYDLTGLPPTFEACQEFLSDPREDSVVIGELIESLLASPHFGERWARHWMDVARYADTKGYVFREDREYHEAYKYRDWLVDAFNSDLAYDRFVTLQLAADLLAQDDDYRDLPALGFLTLGRRFLNNQFDIIDDRLDVVSRGLMGMTLACARCHDHKYDPVSQADYYSMFGVFLNTQEPGGEPWPHRLADAEKERASHILIRGSPRSPGERVPRQFVGFLSPEQKPFGAGSGRVELARRIVVDGKPLTARVMANRIWMRLMGDSLVESPSDFGTRCPQPVQSDLLDQLAIEFVESGWSMKQLIRMIVSSDVYQQQSLDRPECSAVDPENAFYWKMNRRRLDFEALRDTLLATTGQLDRTLFGKPVKIQQAAVAPRRTLYAYIDRQNLPSVFRSFDVASPDAHSPRRAQTSVPQQGLYLLNSSFMAELASRLAVQARQRSAKQDEEQAIGWLFERVYQRRPTAEELPLLTEFVRGYRPPSSPVRVERWIYGFAELAAEADRLDGFQRLMNFTGKAWQGGPALPDKTIGWCLLTAEGGHPGNDAQHAVVRRWIAPRDGFVHVAGKLQHKSDKGDGVRGSLFAAGQLQGQWTAKADEQSTSAGPLEVREGDTLDFVTDCIGGPSHDSFTWKVRVRYQGERSRQWRSDQEFSGPLPERLDVWTQLTQALLAANELATID